MRSDLPHRTDYTSTHSGENDSEPIRVDRFRFEASIESYDTFLDSHLVVYDLSVDAVDAVKLTEIETSRSLDELGLRGVSVGISE
jgi:hypothetical protein